ncbi:MAG: amidohydrolase family protein [Acidimicrobiia bacterium]
MDTVIRNATVVTAGSRSAGVDIGIEGGRIVQLGGAMSAPNELDAAGRYVLPGGIDGHVHLTPAGSAPQSYRWCDDWEAGTAAALAGGITTVGNMSHPDPMTNESIRVSTERDATDGQARSRTDFFLHPVLMDPSPSELEALAELHAAGHTSVKIFLSFRRFDRSVGGYLEALRRTAQHGGLALIHCEDVALMECACTMLREQGKLSPEHFPKGRPVAAERAATERAVAMSEVTGCPIYVVHLSSLDALDACRAGQARGTAVEVETRPIYLFLTEERFAEANGAKYAGAPPLRSERDVAGLWAALAQGSIATVATDHAPWKLADKIDAGLDATNLRLGMSELETMLPMLWWAGVRTGRLSVSRFVEITATNPAKLFGLYPRKGTIAVGSDADLVIWDAERERTIDGSAFYSNADYSPYDGWTVTGWPDVVMSRGEVVVADGRLTDAARPGRGRLAERGPTQPR